MTIARPYVAAAYEFAAAKKDVPAWEQMLESAALVASDQSVVDLMQSPQLSPAELAGFFCDILKSEMDTAKKNFIKLLAENRRLNVLPQISAMFKETRAEEEKEVVVNVTSASPLDKAYQQKLVKALTKRLDRKVKLSCEVDPSLVGGVVIRAGDLVIDGSVRGKLMRLNNFI
jgi:F-type H+-transporting ATPase subunit delta